MQSERIALDTPSWKVQQSCYGFFTLLSRAGVERFAELLVGEKLRLDLPPHSHGTIEQVGQILSGTDDVESSANAGGTWTIIFSYQEAICIGEATCAWLAVGKLMKIDSSFLEIVVGGCRLQNRS